VAGLVDLAARRPWALLAANLLVLAAVMAVAIAGTASLPIGSTAASGSTAGEPDLVVATTGRDPVHSGVYRVALRVISSQVQADPAVGQVRQGPVSKNNRSASLLVSFADVSPSDRQDAVERIETAVDPGPLVVSYGGEAATLLDARHELATDFWRLELLAMPFAALLLALALGARLAAAPIICAATAIAGAVAGLVLLGLVVDVSLLGTAPAAVVGLVLGIEAPCALFARFRAEGAMRAPRQEALRRAVQTTTDLAVPAVVAASVVTVGLVATSLDQAPSMIVGCTLAAALALGSALVCAPAIVWLAGDDRHAAGRAPVTVWLARWPAHLAGRLAGSRRATVLATSIGAALMLAAAIPLIHAQGQPFSALDLPPDSSAVKATALAGITSGAGGDAVFGDLPLAAGVSAVALVVALGVLFRSRLALAIGVMSLLPAAGACGLAVLVFQDGELAGAIGMSEQGAIESGAAASLLVALASVSAGRSAGAMQAAQEATSGGLQAGWVAPWAASLLVPGAILASLIGAAATGVLAGASLYPAREFGLAVAVGLLLDLILVRVPVIAALARRNPS